jgi:RNA polymerase sigma-70 factor (ECF subfamily)
MFSRLRKGTTKEIHDQWDDGRIVAAYRETGDKELVGILFKRYTHLVFGLCIKYLKNVDDAEDAVMEIFEGLFDSLLEHKVENFKSWLHSVSRNHCLMKLRKEKTHLKVVKGVEEESRQAFMELISEMHQDNERDNFTVQQLRAAIELLKEEQRKCIELVYLQEKSYEEVCQITGYTNKQVKSYVQNGRRNLKIRLEAYSAGKE